MTVVHISGFKHAHFLCCKNADMFSVKMGRSSLHSTMCAVIWSYTMFIKDNHYKYNTIKPTYTLKKHMF